MRGTGYVAAILLVAACGGGDPSGPPPPAPPPAPPAVATVTLSATEATLVPDQQVQLTATLRDASGNTLSGRTVDWSSSAIGVATVSNGLVTAVAPGAANITASSEGRSASASITVVDGRQITPSGGVVTAAGGNVTLTIPAGAVGSATAITVAPVASPPVDPRLVPNTAYEFGPSGTQFAQPVTIRIRYQVADVPQGGDPDGFRIFTHTGTAWVELSGSTVDVATRTVTGATTHFSRFAVAMAHMPVWSVTVGPALNLVVGATGQLTATLRDVVGNVLTNHPVTWTSLHPLIATVSQTGSVSAVAAGTATITATAGGRTGQVDVTVVPPVFDLVEITVAGYHACGLNSIGRAWCWGFNDRGQLGDGSTTNRTRPWPVVGDHRFTAIAAGGGQTCALKADGSAWCWGHQPGGGVGGFPNLLVPTEVPGFTFASIAVGTSHKCALTPQGEAWCWGHYNFGALGNAQAPVTGSTVPIQVAGDIRYAQISAGWHHTCGVSAQTRVGYCWGNNGDPLVADAVLGGLGTGVLALRVLEPMPVQNVPQWAEIAGGGSEFRCGRVPAGVVGTIFCWGNNRRGQTGQVAGNTFINPVQIQSGLQFTSVVSGASHTCGLTPIGEAWCWGYNSEGNLGNGLQTNSHVPVRVAAGTIRFTRIAAGYWTTCGIDPAGDTWCWGRNTYGALGDGTTTNRSLPVKVAP